MKLENYVNGDISESELEKVTKQLVTAKIDADNKKRWSGLLKEKYGIEREIPRKEKKIIPLKRFHLWQAAAAVILLLGICIPAYRSWDGNLQRSVDRLITADHFVNREGDKKGGQVDLSALRQKAALAYNQQQYAMANDMYLDLVNSEDKQRSDYFYSGLCFLKQGEPIGAAGQLLLARQQPDEQNRFLPEIQWYLGLALLKADDPDGAREEWNSIPKGGYHYKDAQELLEKF